MFKKAVEAKSQQRLSGADRKKLKRIVRDRFPNVSDADIDLLLPPKVEITVTKYPNRVLVYGLEGECPMFFDGDGRGTEIFPTVYALWKVPDLLPAFLLKGGEVSRYVLGGADLMFPGIHVPPEGLPSFSAGEPWAIKVPGNPAPIAVGSTTMSSTEALKAGLRGKALKICHYYHDTLWESAENCYVPNTGFSEDAVFEDPTLFSSGLASNSCDDDSSVGHTSIIINEYKGDASSTDEAAPNLDFAAKNDLSLPDEVSGHMISGMVDLQVAENASGSESVVDDQHSSSVVDVDALLDKCLLQALHDSDTSNYSSDNDNDNDNENGSGQQSKPNSLNPSWPQSYRQSIDLYSSVPSPSLNFLGTPSLSRLGSSFLSSSLTRRHTPEILPTLSKPLIPETEKPKERRSSHSLLPPIPSRKPSLKKLTPDSKSAVSHEIPVSRHSSFSQAVVNGMNVLCGVGVLSTPYAVKEGGWLGLSILLIFAVLSYYTGILLRSCLDSQPGLETYPDIGQAAFGTAGRVAISIILYVELYACCVEFIILESDNLSSLFPNAHLNLGILQLDAHHLFAVMTALAVLPTVWLRDLSVLSYISVGGVIASILVVGCLFWVGLVDQVGFQTEGRLLNLSSLPVAIGLYGYCYSGHAVFPNIYTSMEKPSQYPGVLLTSFGICTVIYASVAVLGYLMFGESTESQFTLNMPQELVASKIAVWTTVVNPFTKFALTMSPVAMSLEELIPSGQAKSYMYSILIRTALVMSTLLVALTVPFFGLVMALIGSLLTMLVTLILPCTCYLSILRGKVTLFQVSMCVLVIGVGVVSAAFGTYSALSQIIQNLTS